MKNQFSAFISSALTTSSVPLNSRRPFERAQRINSS